MKVFVAALILVGLCVLGMCVGVLFHRGFPKSDIDDNPELRKRGIQCFRYEDERLRKEAPLGQRALCSGEYSPSCRGCAFFELEKTTNK